MDASEVVLGEPRHSQQVKEQASLQVLVAMHWN
jgi:hypothetical protein